MIITVTGHRPDKLGGYSLEDNEVFQAVMEALDKKLVELKPEIVYTGMALGVDQWAAELCGFNDIPYIAAIPFPGFPSKWTPESKKIYQDLCSKAKDIKIVTNTETYHPSLMQKRNEYMVNKSDLIVAVWDGSSGGTANCIKYAKSVGKEVAQVSISPQIWKKAHQIYEINAAKKTAKKVMSANMLSSVGQAYGAKKEKYKAKPAAKSIDVKTWDSETKEVSEAMKNSLKAGMTVFDMVSPNKAPLLLKPLLIGSPNAVGKASDVKITDLNVFDAAINSLSKITLSDQIEQLKYQLKLAKKEAAKFKAITEIQHKLYNSGEGQTVVDNEVEIGKKKGTKKSDSLKPKRLLDLDD